MEWLREGDTLHVHSIDRLARNLFDLQDIVERLTERGVTVNFHKENLRFSGGDGDPMQKLMLQMMGAFAEFERDLINERRKEGMAAARDAGKQIGAKRKLSPESVTLIRQRINDGETKKALAEEHGVSRQTLHDAFNGIGAYA